MLPLCSLTLPTPLELAPGPRLAPKRHRARLCDRLHWRNGGRQCSLDHQPLRRQTSWPSISLRHTHINIGGSLIVGFFIIWTSERVLVDPRWRLLIVVGFCGAFTTFSSYAFETMAYSEQGQWALMVANVLSNNLLCLGAVLVGMALARVL